MIGLVCVEHTGLNPNQYDIESMSLLFYDEVMRGVEALIRDRHWSLLITYLREDELLAVQPGRHAPAGGTGEPVLPRLHTLSGKVDGLLIGEGVVPTTALARLARRLPVVVVAGDPGCAASTWWRPTTGRARTRWSATWSSTTADVGCTTSTGRRPRPTPRPGGSPCRPSSTRTPGAKLVGANNGRFSVRSGEAAAEQMLAEFGGVERRPARRDHLLERPDGHRRAPYPDGTRIRVPDDIALIGFDDIYPATLCDPPLTTVNQPIRSIGERACERLIERIATPTLRPSVELLPTELVIRSSCGCPPGTVCRMPVETVLRWPPSVLRGNNRRWGDITPRPDTQTQTKTRSNDPIEKGRWMGMSFLLRRLAFYVVAAWVALTVNFFIPRAMPGNAVQSIMDKFPELAARCRIRRSRRCSASATRARCWTPVHDLSGRRRPLQLRR